VLVKIKTLHAREKKDLPSLETEGPIRGTTLIDNPSPGVLSAAVTVPPAWATVAATPGGRFTTAAPGRVQ